MCIRDRLCSYAGAVRCGTAIAYGAMAWSGGYHTAAVPAGSGLYAFGSVSPYALPMRCPVLTYSRHIRPAYAINGTDIPYAAMPGTDTALSAYTTHSTDIQYGATRAKYR
eukprot:3937137-Rhodomonas_salina.1